MHFIYVSVTAKQKVYWHNSVTSDLLDLAFFLDCGPASFWHFSVIADLRVFEIFRELGPASFLGFSVTLTLQVLGFSQKC